MPTQKPMKRKRSATRARNAARSLAKIHASGPGPVRRRFGCCYALYCNGGEGLQGEFRDTFCRNKNGSYNPFSFIWPIPDEGPRYRWKTHTEPRLIALCLFAAMLENP